MSTVYNFHKVSDQLACSGQPHERELTIIAADGFKVVINLGLPDGKYALNDEAASVQSLGMTYFNIPVVFDNPQADELTAFISLMDKHAGEKVLVHCAANYRASCFTGLYLLKKGVFTPNEMQTFIEEVWQPDGIWQQFVDEVVEGS